SSDIVLKTSICVALRPGLADSPIFASRGGGSHVGLTLEVFARPENGAKLPSIRRAATRTAIHTHQGPEYAKGLAQNGSGGVGVIGFLVGGRGRAAEGRGSHQTAGWQNQSDLHTRQTGPAIAYRHRGADR